MYYEESVIDGILHYRNDPKREWISFSIEELTIKHQVQKDNITSLIKIINEIDTERAKNG